MMKEKLILILVTLFIYSCQKNEVIIPSNNEFFSPDIEQFDFSNTSFEYDNSV